MTLSACSVKKIATQDTVRFCVRDSTDYVQFTMNAETTMIDWHKKSIGVMDTQHDTIPKFKVELPTFKQWASSGREFFFFYPRGRAIFFNIGSYSDTPLQFQAKEENDSLIRLAPKCYDIAPKLMRKILPDSGKYNFKCIYSKNTRIYIYNFNKEETEKIIDQIKNSIEYISY